MIDCDLFWDHIQQHQPSLFTGVPDSLLKHFCACVTERTEPDQHIIAANEGAAIALATGSYLATGRPGVVYMQNSGLGNAINPLVSLADPKVYAIPMLLMIGWRGEPGVPDEPQHIKQGEVTLGLLKTLGIRYEILPSETTTALEAVDIMLDRCIQEHCPTAIVVRKDSFAPYRTAPDSPSPYPLTREQALGILLAELNPHDAVVSTTGMTSREIFELREASGMSHAQDFLTVGSMGHCSQIAMGIAMAQPNQRVVCIDGDGSVIMHMGSLAVLGQAASSKNILHIIINNGKHDSVGGQPTVGQNIDLPAIAKACGYASAVSVTDPAALRKAIHAVHNSPTSCMIEIKVRGGARSDLGRPTSSPLENKKGFIAHLRSTS